MVKEKMVKKVKKIVSHLPPRHLDDFLAIAYLKAIHPEAEIEFMHPQKVQEEYYEDVEVCLVDVGGRWEPEKSNFDHHQNPALPCSLALILFKDNPEDYRSYRWLYTLSVIDVEGFKKAEEKGLVRANRELDEIRKIILQTEITDAVALPVYLCLVTALENKDLDYDAFVLLLKKNLEKTAEFQKALSLYEETRRKYREKVSQVVFFEKEGIKVGLSKGTLSPFHSDFFSESGVALLIERNPMNEKHTSFIVNTSSPVKEKAFELRECLLSTLNKKEVFRHATGFLVVIDAEVDEVIPLLCDALLDKCLKA